jgi:hypothetical protein
MDTDVTVDDSEPIRVLNRVRGKGARLWLLNGELHYEAPRGALGPDEIENLRMYKRAIIELLKGSAEGEFSEPSAECQPASVRAPLAFSQLAHWNLYQLQRRPSVRNIASATRLRGRLNVEALQSALNEIIRRQNSLRTRIVVTDGVPAQEILGSAHPELIVADLRAFPRPREHEVQRQIEQLVLDPIDVTVGPLFGVKLLRLDDEEHVLILAMEHLISDAFSMAILLRDLFKAYMQASSGQPFDLPPVAVQFADYAVGQREDEQTLAEQHRDYWARHLSDFGRLPFPRDNCNAAEVQRAGWGEVPIELGPELTKELRHWSRMNRTTLAMSTFTAFVAIVLRWCGAAECVLQFQADGRITPEIENTIGYFATPLYLRIGIRSGDTFVDLLQRVVAEYCQAHEHADFYYMEAVAHRPEFAFNTIFNWVPNNGLPEQSRSDKSLTWWPIAFTDPMLKHVERDNEPSVLLYENADEVTGGVRFPRARFSDESMQTLGRNFLLFIRELLRSPHKCVTDISFIQ